MDRLPKSISPCPIVEALVEIRFETQLPHDAVFGLFYTSIKDRYPVVEKLFPLQLPDVVRMQDPDLKFTPYYKLKSDNLFCQVGPRVLSINCIREYLGWTEYFSEIQRVLKKITQQGIVSSLSRLGVRYINFFEADVSEGVNLDISFKGNSLIARDTTLRSRFDSGRFTSFLRFASKGSFVDGETKKQGTILDIDTFVDLDNEEYNLDALLKLIDEGHEEEKRLFFSLLKQEYVDANLNPVYEE